jgi:hypothetical protein
MGKVIATTSYDAWGNAAIQDVTAYGSDGAILSVKTVSKDRKSVV